MRQSVIVKFDKRSGAYTDGNHYVKGSLIRAFAVAKLGRAQTRGRLAKDEISHYWSHVFNLNAEVTHV